MNEGHRGGRNRFVVTYDIADDQRRTRVARVLRNHGDRLQYSVFQCDLNAREVVALRAALSPLLAHREDQVLLVDLGPANATGAERVESVGRPYEPHSPARIV